MDIADYDGDKNNKINTIPVIFGKDLSWYISHLILKFTIIIITIALYCITNLNMSLGFCLMSTFILLTNSQDIKKYNYSKNIIDFSSKQTNRLMFLILTILCIAAKL
jgi:4-hydroxybenzoate polyprenyltransferase